MAARKKNPAARARANRATTRQTFDPSQVVPVSRRPRLPQLRDSHGRVRAWNPEARKFWDNIWSMPQAATFTQSQRSVMLLAARTIDIAWRTDSLTAVASALGRVDAVLEKHGLTPYGMLRLEWQYEETDAAKAAGQRRRATAAPAPGPPAKGKDAPPDPRRKLHAV